MCVCVGAGRGGWAGFIGCSGVGFNVLLGFRLRVFGRVEGVANGIRDCYNPDNDPAPECHQNVKGINPKP